MERYDAKRRKAIIDVAKSLNCKDIEYLDKNSTISDKTVIKQIYHHHCANDTIARMFKEKIDKLTA